MKILAMIAILLAATVGQAMAGVVSSTNTADFNLTFVGFADFTNEMTTPLVSNDGSLTLEIAATGHPTTSNYFYSEWTNKLSGSEYALGGDENFDIKFNAYQTAFAMNYLDTSIPSTFALNFFDGTTGVGSISFTTSSFDTAQFIGFISSLSFNKVTVREDDGSSNSDEYFQFYRATSATAAVPEPTTMLLLGLGLIGLAGVRRLRK